MKRASMFKAKAREMPQTEGPGIQLQVLSSELSIEHVRKYTLKWLGGLGDKSVLDLSCVKVKI